MNKEFICMEETVSDTQKKIRAWVSTGYQIEIIEQNVTLHELTLIDKLNDRPQLYVIVITSLWRWKK